MLIVQKFGGSSVADNDKLINVARRIIATKESGHDIVVVVSAQGDTTDEFIERARQVNSQASKRELDVLLSCGEQISISLLAMALGRLGVQVVSLTGWQIGCVTDNTAGNAKIKSVDTKRIVAELDAGKIVIVAGFQGVSENGDITTLGRGGSDTSAVALAAVLSAQKCEIYTDVDGVYTADPRIVRTARKLQSIDYDEMLEYASLGANVLHSRSVELSKKYNVELEVRSSFVFTEGTVIKKEESKMEGTLIKGVTRDDDVARVALIEIKNNPGAAFKIFSALAKRKINVDVIVQPISRDGCQDISFTTSKSNLKDALKIIDANKDVLNITSVEAADNLSKVSIIGAGMINNVGVAALMFESLYEAGIDIHIISTSEIKISVLVEQKDSELAVKVIHDKFGLS